MAYNLTSLLRNNDKRKAMDWLKTTGAKQAAQMFIDLYMTSSDMSDLENRLGKVITDTTETTVTDLSFPPYNLPVTRAGLGVRAGGFKQLNDRIIQLQNINRILTGEIRTKITEWDISLYLQEEWIDDMTLFDLSLLYRIYDDNALNVSDSRSLTCGIINTAMSYERFENYNPSADPDLKFWVPPTDDLSASSTPPIPRTLAGWFSRLTSLLTTTKPILSKWQKEEVQRAIDAGWTSWYPEYWRLLDRKSVV